jgi:PIN domain nuclease of toxin-antitoxin system
VKLLLDAHVLLWWLIDDERLPAPVADLIDDPNVHTAVSVVSLWELMIKYMRGRLRLPDDPARVFTEVVDRSGFRVLAAERRHVMALPELPDVHTDPFDRMLVAQALVEGMSIVTADPAISRYPIDVVW